MAKNAKISNAVIKRLPRYRRYLHELDKKGVDKISSAELSRLIGYTASQILQDLNNFGGFGQQGYGYNVKDLHDEISAILGLDQVYHMVIVGGGNLGHAIAGYTNSYKQGFQVEAIFEVNPDAIGSEIGGVPVLSSDELVEFVEANKIDIGVICTPKDVAQEMADKLCFAGVRGIWNFAQTDLEVPTHVAMENVHLSDNLYALTFHMNRM
ncbi:MAG: redox-sensing transcriptional repressor Rex [Firmicutes bacterium]|nr:redox-sensing transcriptional repressor Rex [Bacillota bacterium]